MRDQLTSKIRQYEVSHIKISDHESLINKELETLTKKLKSHFADQRLKLREELSKDIESDWSSKVRDLDCKLRTLDLSLQEAKEESL